MLHCVFQNVEEHTGKEGGVSLDDCPLRVVEKAYHDALLPRRQAKLIYPPGDHLRHVDRHGLQIEAAGLDILEFFQVIDQFDSRAGGLADSRYEARLLFAQAFQSAHEQQV